MKRDREHKYRIMNIGEILEFREGSSYQNRISVMISGKGKNFHLCGDTPLYINAFSYAIPLAGSAILSVNGEDYNIDNRSLCILSPLHMSHFKPSDNDFHCIFLSASKDFIDASSNINVKRCIMRGTRIYNNPVMKINPEERKLLLESVLDVKRQIERYGHIYHVELIRNALERFYLETDNIIENLMKPINNHGSHEYKMTSFKHTTGKSGAEERFLPDFVTLMMNNFKKEHNIAFYASKLHITPQYLTSIIKKATGKSASDFIREMLFSEARNMLAFEQIPIQQIAYELNYSDQSAFTKFFRSMSGCSPSDFRNKYKTTHSSYPKDF